MPKQDIQIRTADGACPTALFASTASKAGVILYMDAFGPRPALYHMAERLAGDGYTVLVPDLYYTGTAHTVPTTPGPPSAMSRSRRRSAR